MTTTGGKLISRKDFDGIVELVVRSADRQRLATIKMTPMERQYANGLVALRILKTEGDYTRIQQKVVQDQLKKLWKAIGPERAKSIVQAVERVKNMVITDHPLVP